MALFSKQKDTEKKEQNEAVEKKETKASQGASFKPQAPSVLVSPRITEKAAIKAERHAYVFNVASTATKSEIAKEVKARYKVTPVKVRTIQVPSKKTFRRGRRGVKGGGKKAYVYLKKGETIDIL